MKTVTRHDAAFCSGLTPRSAASDLGLHCVHMSQKWDARLIWVDMRIYSIEANTDKHFLSNGVNS